jgi:hypothetical protein
MFTCSEEKAKLLRRVGTQVDEKDTELAAFMASLQLDSLNLHSGSGEQLPQVCSYKSQSLIRKIIIIIKCVHFFFLHVLKIIFLLHS